MRHCGHDGVNLFGPGCFKDFGAFGQSSAAGGNIIDQRNGFAFERVAAANSKGVFDIVPALGFRQIPLPLGITDSHQIGTNMSRRQTKMTRQIQRLIIPSLEASAPMQGDGNKQLYFPSKTAGSQGVAHHSTQTRGIFGTLVKFERQNQVA